jgi:hypothetical protein
LPDISPSAIKSLTWTFRGTDENEVLLIRVYGKNYQTNKYHYSYAKFPVCLVREPPTISTPTKP